jgi:hypothetical protein
MEKLNDLLKGVNVYGLNVAGFVANHVKDNNQTAYEYLQTVTLLEILKELKELKELKSNDNETVETKTKVTKAKEEKTEKAK